MIIAVCLNAAIDVTYSVPALTPGASHRVSAVTNRAGGKGVNVARVLHQLGEQVMVAGFVGGGAGTAVAQDLRVAGIEARWRPIAADSRQTVTIVADGTATVFNEPGGTVTALEWTLLRADIERLCSGAAVVVLSGSLPPGVPLSAYAELTTLARRAGATVIVDAEGAALEQALTAAPDVVKPNAEEAARLLGWAVDTREAALAAARVLLTRGAGAVLISRGAAGLVAARATDAVEVRLARTVDGNPTGAGDALAAALAQGLRSGRTWRELLVDSVAIAAGAVAWPTAGGFDATVAAELRPLIEMAAL